MAKDKEQAQSDFIAMIKNSWTYAKMTKEERGAVITLLWDSDTYLRGDWFTRCNTLHGIYAGFLAGLGYTGGDWR